jgi:hypothetical protein
MKALISPIEKILDSNNNVLGERIAQIDSTEFPVADPLYWIDCPDDITYEYYWNPTSNSFELPPVDTAALEEYKLTKKQYIDNIRDDQIAKNGIIMNDISFDSDNNARKLLTETITVLNVLPTVPEFIPWKDSNNVTRNLTFDDLKTLATLMFEKGLQVMNESWMIKDAIDAATTHEEVDAAIFW